MKILTGRAVAGAMAFAAAFIATTGNASAATWPGTPDHVWSKPGVRVEVWEHGDTITVTDTKANGHSAAVEVWVGGKKRWMVYASLGKGSHSTRGANYGGAYDLPEGAEVALNFWGEGYNDGYTDKSFVNDQ
ncbi:hypothetical protein ACWD9K_36980 [Streptomyces sp. 900116325]